MNNAIAIAKKELNIYFATPIAYVMFTLFVVIGSYFFLRLLGAYEQASLMYMRFNAQEMVNRLNFQDAIFRNLFGNLGVILIFIIPFLTMRLIAEERRSEASGAAGGPYPPAEPTVINPGIDRGSEKESS